MSDIKETIAVYQKTCKEEGIKPNPYFMRVLKQETSDTTTEQHDTMRLYLAGNNKLITDYRITDADCVIIYKWLRNNLYVVSMDLRYNNITDDGIVHISKLIQETAHLEEINLMCNDFGKAGAKHLADALLKNETLKILRLNGNKIGNEGGMYFAQALQVNVTLESLDLGDTDLKTESLIALATVLNYNQSLQALNINRPILFTQQEEPTIHFAKMLKVNKALKELHMEKYNMTDFGVKWIAEHMFDNFTLTYLDLSCNRITRDGAKELAKLLKYNTPLKVLDLGFNRLGDDGARHLAEALATYNSHLTTLVLVSNEINGKGLVDIADCMQMNTILSNVYIWGNNLEESACIAFAGLLENGRLEAKNTDVQSYVVDGITYLSEVSNGLKKDYYWSPTHGENASPDLKKFARKSN